MKPTESRTAAHSRSTAASMSSPGLRVVPGPLPLPDVLEQGALGDVPGVDGGDAGGVEQLAALASGQGREGHRGERRPVGGGADLADAAGSASPACRRAAAMTPMALTPEVLPWSLAVLMEV